MQHKIVVVYTIVIYKMNEKCLITFIKRTNQTLNYIKNIIDGKCILNRNEKTFIFITNNFGLKKKSFVIELMKLVYTCTHVCISIFTKKVKYV